MVIALLIQLFISDEMGVEWPSGNILTVQEKIRGSIPGLGQKN